MLTSDRNTPRRDGDLVGRKAKGATEIFAGALVALDANGFAIPGATATGLTADGRAEEHIDNTGADGDETVTVRKGVFLFANDATDTVVQADIGGTAYIVDDETVANTDGTGTRSAAGTIVDVDADGVWVRID